MAAFIHYTEEGKAIYTSLPTGHRYRASVNCLELRTELLATFLISHLDINQSREMYIPGSTKYVIVALVMIKTDIGWSPVGIEGMDFIFRCDDISDAINYLYEHIPAEMTLADKCRRYAVMVSYLKPMGRLHNKAVSQVLRMPEEQLNQVYQESAANDQLGAFYMTAIDGFRAASFLRPPFLELIECLKQLNNSSLKPYLHDEELNIIIGLYKHVLESPDAKVYLNLIPNLNRYRRAFVVGLINMFKDKIHYDSEVNQVLARSGIVGASSSSLPGHVRKGEMAESERREERKQERRRLASHRHNEQCKLKSRRMKILSPGLAREKAKMQLEKRRKAERDRILEPMVITFRPPVSFSSPSDHLYRQQQQRPQQSFVQSTSPSLPLQLGPREAPSYSTLIEWNDLDLANQTYDALMDSETRDEPSLSGYTGPIVEHAHRFEETDSILESLLAATPMRADSAHNSDQVDVNEYLLPDHDLDDENKKDDDK